MSGPPVIPASALLPALQRTEALLSSLRALVLSTTSPTGLAEGNLKPGAQTALLRAARGIVRALELTPYDVVFGYSELAHAYGAAATLIDLGVLDKIPGIADDEAPNGKGVCVGAAAPNGAAVKKKDGKTIDELAAEINEGKEGKIGEVDPTLLARTVRMCVADEILEEISDPAPASGQASPSEALAAARRHPRYRHNFRSRFLVSPSVHPRGMGGALVMSLDFSIPALRMHEYVRTHTVEQFRDHRRSPYSWAAGQEGKTIYEILDSGDPQRRARFFGTMRASEKAQPVKGMFPFASVVTPEAYDRSRALVVDVGGGHGRALVAIRAELRAAGWGHDAPSQPRMVLEELPAVVKKVAELADPELGDVETVAYDMFTPQIVKNAYIYFFRRVLHNYYDDVGVEILRNTATAMGPESRVVVCEMVVPDRVDLAGASEVYRLDMAMAAIGGKQKTVREWEALFDAAGLELVAVYPSAFSATAMLEARLKR